MYIALSILHVFIAAGLILIVLLQSGKGADIGAAFGGGSSQTVFGGRGATDFLSKATMVLGGLFFAMSLALALISSHSTRQESSLIGREARRATTSAQTQQQQGAAPSGGAQAPAADRKSVV